MGTGVPASYADAPPTVPSFGEEAPSPASCKDPHTSACLSPMSIPPHFPRDLFHFWGLTSQKVLPSVELVTSPPDSHPPAGLHPQLPSSRVALRSLGAISRKLPESQRHPAVTPPSANLATPHPCPPSPSLDESLFPQDWHWDQM